MKGACSAARGPREGKHCRRAEVALGGLTVGMGGVGEGLEELFTRALPSLSTLWPLALG